MQDAYSQSDVFEGEDEVEACGSLVVGNKEIPRCIGRWHTSQKNCMQTLKTKNELTFNFLIFLAEVFSVQSSSNPCCADGKVFPLLHRT